MYDVRHTARVTGGPAIEVYRAGSEDFPIVENLLEFYTYEFTDHSLEQVISGELRQEFGESAIGDQPWIYRAAAIIIITANIESMNCHFSEQSPVNKRGERYVYIETGAAAQNIQLQGTALNIGMVLVGGFDNSSVKSILKLPNELEPTALLCIGNV